MRYAMLPAVGIALVLAAAALEAQQRPARRQEPIEIRGTVPTPQVVTVRPRETPAYSRKVLVPNFYDHDFWPSILPAYVLVAERVLSGQPPADTMMRADTLGTRRDSLGRFVPPPAARIDTMPVRPDTLRATPPARPPVPPPASEERTLSHALPSPHTPGTASASRTPRQQSLNSLERRF